MQDGKYKKAPSTKVPVEIKDNEIRITAKGKDNGYLRYANNLLNVSDTFFTNPTRPFLKNFLFNSISGRKPKRYNHSISYG